MRERAQRFEIKRPVAFRLKSPGPRKEGSGQTLNISKSGVLFETEMPIATGRKIDMTVEVGDALGGPPVTLQVEGITIRSEEGSVAVAIKKHKLRPVDVGTD